MPKLHSAELGERYSDDSGWKRRALLDTQADQVEIDMQGSSLVGTVDDAIWLFDALKVLIDTLKP